MPTRSEDVLPRGCSTKGNDVFMFIETSKTVSPLLLKAMIELGYFVGTIRYQIKIAIAE